MRRNPMPFEDWKVAFSGELLEFFDRKFDANTQLNLKVNKSLNFIRVEKDGYYSGEINIPKRPIQDYKAKVILRPKPSINSLQFISNTIDKLKIISECEIQFYDDVKLKNESCH